MAIITALTENFENASDGDTISTGGTIFTNVYGSGGSPTFSSTQTIEGPLAMRAAPTSGSSTGQVSFAPESTVWMSFYVYVATSPQTTYTLLANWFDDGTKVGDIGLRDTGEIRLRDVFSTVFTSSSPLATGQWHRISFRADPSNATGHRLKIYSGANLHTTTATEDSGDLTSSAAATTIDSISLGQLTTDTSDIYFDRILSNDSTEPAPKSIAERVFKGPETLEGGTDGADLTTANTDFDYIAPAAPVFDTDSHAGVLAMRADASAAYARHDFPERSSVFTRTYIKMGDATWPAFYALQQTGNSTVRAILRVSVDGSLRMRSDSASLGSQSTAGLITSTEYARVEWMVTTTIQRLRVYTSANVDGATPDYDSGDLTWTAGGTTERTWVGNVAAISGVDVLIDDHAVGDDWIGPRDASVAVLAQADFESGSDGANLTTANTSFNEISSTAPTFSNNAFNGMLAMGIFNSNGASYAGHTFPERNSVFTRTYYKVASGSLPDHYSIQHRSFTTRAYLRIQANGSLRMRSEAANLGVASPAGLINSTSYSRVEWMVTATTQRVRVYTGANVNGTSPDYDSGDVSWSSTGTISNTRVGLLTGGIGLNMLIDDHAVGDDWIGPATTTPPPNPGPGPSMTDWQRGSNQSGSYFAGNSFYKPSSAVADDWMILTLTQFSSSVVTDADGWTLIAENYAIDGALRSTVFAKTVQSGEFGWAFTHSTTAAIGYTLMWGKGAAPVSEWGYGVWMPRNRTGSGSTNVASPGIATFTPNSLVLTISTERSSSIETGITSMSGATEWFFQGHTDGMLETQSIGYNYVAVPGVTPNVTVTYPNTRTLRGNIVQFALPPAGYTSTDVGSVRAVATASSDDVEVSSLDIAVPATAQVCDSAVVIGNMGAGSAATMSGPAGYTQIANAASTSGNAQLGVWYKKLNSNDAGQTLTLTNSASKRMAATIVVLADSSYGVVSSIVQGTSASAATVPTVTPTLDNALLLGIVSAGANSGATDITPPLHWSEESQLISTTASSTKLANYVVLHRVKAGAAIATYNYYDLVKFEGAVADYLAITLAFSKGPDSGITVTVWDGTTRILATVHGVWDGTQIICGDIKGIGS